MVCKIAQSMASKCRDIKVCYAIANVNRNMFFFFKQKTAYEIGTGDWSSDVCSSDLHIQKLICNCLQPHVPTVPYSETDLQLFATHDPMVPYLETDLQLMFQWIHIQKLICNCFKPHVPMVPYLETDLQDRKSVVQGKSVDLGGRRIIKKKTTSTVYPCRS